MLIMNKLPKMNNEKGVIHLLLPLLIFVIVGVGIFLITQGYINIPGVSFPSIPLFEKKASYELKSEYKNPFKKETQYVNPFDKYKNPFVLNR